MKYGVLSVIALFFLAGGAMANKQTKPALPVIFDTDMGNDVDDLLAMQMLMNYESDSRVKVLGIGLSKANGKAYDFVRGYYRQFGCGNPGFGFLTYGPNPDDGSYLLPALAALAPDTVREKGCESVDLYRRLLAASADSSMTIIATGPMTNMARLLESAPDSISPLAGEELIRRKVSLLSIMGGGFKTDAPAEWNILQDSVSARKVFDRWPTALVASGYEIGEAIHYPHESITGDYAPGHPLRVAYESYLPMPYDRECWDLTTVLYTVEPDSAWFGVSPEGEISVDSLGRTSFRCAEKGRRRILSIACDSLPQVLVDRVLH